MKLLRVQVHLYPLVGGTDEHHTRHVLDLLEARYRLVPGVSGGCVEVLVSGG